MAEPYIDASVLMEVEESKLNERNAEGDPTPEWAVSTYVYARYAFYGFPPFDFLFGIVPDPTATFDRYLQRRDRNTYLLPNDQSENVLKGWITPGGEYREIVTQIDQITGVGTELPPVFYPDQLTYERAGDRTEPLEDGENTVTSTYRKAVLTNVFLGPVIMDESWVTEINTFESACAKCAELLAEPDIDDYPILTAIGVFQNGNLGPDPFGFGTLSPDPAYSIGETVVNVVLPNIVSEDGTELPLSFFDQLAPGGASYHYTQSISEINMTRSKTIGTGPVCVYTRRIQHPHMLPDQWITTTVECSPFAESDNGIDGIVTLYFNPPCQRGDDFWIKSGIQRRNMSEFGVAECELPTHSGAPPDCSGS